MTTEYSFMNEPNIFTLFLQQPTFAALSLNLVQGSDLIDLNPDWMSMINIFEG